MAVTTGIGAKQPGFLGKVFGKKPTPGVVIYVCCQDCAAKVKNNPWPYLTEVIAERGGYAGPLAQARGRDQGARR